MGFLSVKRQVIQCLEKGTYDHEIRSNIDVKNLFQCGQISDEFVIDLIKATRGNEYSVSPHHKVPAINVHILKPSKSGRQWYIKFYFTEPDVVFISVHESEI